MIITPKKKSRASTSSYTVHYGLPSLHECQNYLGGGGGLDVFGREGREKYFSRPSRPPLPPRAIIPAARPLGTFENQDTRDGKTRYMKGSHAKIRTVNSLTSSRTILDSGFIVGGTGLWISLVNRSFNMGYELLLLVGFRIPRSCPLPYRIPSAEFRLKSSSSKICRIPLSTSKHFRFRNPDGPFVVSFLT